MAKTKNDIPLQKQEGITALPLEEVMHKAMMPYAEYVILERALPRVEDGLKPVQRRILYTMLELNLTPDKAHRKSARIVGDALGKYHPHGDTSVYDAMVRMAQNFNMRYPLVDGQGNFGSIDGDSAAAMRYTEAKMSPIAMKLLEHIDKETVNFRLNFDDTLKEPDMLPARFPNLLLNGSTGIAVGLATNIPPHNLTEVIDAVIAKIRKPNISLEELMCYIKAPDFPLGGQIIESEEIEKAYRTGKGRLIIRAKTHIEKLGNGKQLIVITELPYQVNKAVMLEKILALSEQKREIFAGIADIRDESDRTGIRAVIELRANVDADKMLNYLYKYSDLQINFGVNMVVIAAGQPVQLGLSAILHYYIEYQKAITTRRLNFELMQAEKREHILAGLIIAVKNIDRVIKIIRSSKNPAQAKATLMEVFDLTGIQAQAILDMRLARLTALEIESLEREYAQVLALIARLNAILNSEKLLHKMIITEHEEIKTKFGDARRTELICAQTNIVIDENDFKVIEDTVILLTQSGAIKRMNPKTFAKGREINEEHEQIKTVINTTTDKKLLIFTNIGNMYSVNIELLADSKWKDKGTLLNSLFAGIGAEEEIIYITCGLLTEELLFTTKTGMLKRVSSSEFDVKKSKIAATGLRENDELICIEPIWDKKDLLLITKYGMSIKMKIEDIPVLSRTAKGVIGIKLIPKDSVILSVITGKTGDVVVISERGYAKRTHINSYEIQGRAGKGVKTINFLKNAVNGKELVFAKLASEGRFTLTLKNNESINIEFEKIHVMDKASKGAPVVNVVLDNIIIKCIDEGSL